MNLIQKPSEVRKKLGYFGIGGAITLLGRKALILARRGECFREFLIVLSEPRPSSRAMAAARDHTFRMASLSDLEALSRDPASNILDRDIESFKEGCQCLLQMDGDKLVGYTWIVDFKTDRCRLGLPSQPARRCRL